MNNLSYWLARIYYKLVGITVDPIPTTFKAEYWAERIYRFITGLPVGITDGKPIQFWFELWFYHVTGQSHRLATGTQSAWFWLSKLYAHYAGLSLDGVLVPASDEFWASKLLEVVSGSGGNVPEMRVVIEGTPVTDGGTYNAGTVDVSTTLQKTVTIHNDGNANLTVTSPPVTGGDVSAGAISGTTITPGNSVTFTLTVSTSTPGSKSGTVSIANNDFDENPYNWTVTATVNETLSNYTEVTNPHILVLRMDAVAGVTELNRGTAGAAANATISGCTLGQTIGSQPAFDFDGVDDNLSIPNVAALANMTTQRWAFLVRPDTLGEASRGTLFAWGNGGGDDNNFLRLNTNNNLTAQFYNTTPTGFTWTSTTNDMLDLIGANGWVFADFDNATSRKMRFWKYVAGGSLTQLTLSANGTMTGTFKAPTASLYLGNRSGLDLSFDGKIGRILAKDALWTTDEMNQIITLSGI